jgi:hypothetical protein
VRGAALLFALVASARAESIVVNMAPSFRPGPYSMMKVSPSHPEHVAISTPDGHVLVSFDGGVTTFENRAISTREYYPMVLRGEGGSRRQFGRASGRSAHRLFISMLNQGLPGTRWASWMSLEDPSTEILDLALPSAAGGPMAAASPSGLFISDDRQGVWSRMIGGPRPKGNQLWATAVVYDPTDGNNMLVGTSEGLWVSHNGGRHFAPHPDKKLAEEQFRQFIWDEKDPKIIFAVTADSVYKSEDRGASFANALSVPGELNGVAVAEDGVYVATTKGLIIYAGEGNTTRFKDEPVVGVVPLGEGEALVATDRALYVSGAKDKRALMTTTSTDPFLRLSGTPKLAWALTRYGIFRIGAKEPRSQSSARPAKVNLSLDATQWAVVEHLAIGTPKDTRLADRWYAHLLPTVSVEVQGANESSNTISFDGTFPISYRSAQGSNTSYCCGAFGTGNPTALVWAKWDLAKIFFGPYGNVSMPTGLVEVGLRGFRTKIMEEVRWRYREARELVLQLKRPPDDAKTELFWRLRLKEHAAYLQAMSGREVFTLNEEERDD